MGCTYIFCSLQKLGFLHCKFSKHCNTAVLRKLYESLIRPNLAYCCIVWDPFTKGSIEHLEKTQKLAAKICLKKWNLSYTTMLRELNLPTLQSRRHIMKLCVVYAILNDSMYFPSGIFVYRNSSISTRTNTPLCLQPVHCSTKYFMFSFVPHSILLWRVSHHACLDLHHCCLLNVYYMFGSSSLSLFCLVHSSYLLTILH